MQSENALSPINVIEFGKKIEISELLFKLLISFSQKDSLFL